MSAELPAKMYVSVHEAAQIVGLHRQTIEKAIARGDFATKRIGGRIMILTESLRPEPMKTWWRHVVKVDGVRVWVTVAHNDHHARIEVSLDRRYVEDSTVRIIDAHRLIPADLTERRIVLEAIHDVVVDAADPWWASVDDATLRRVLADIDAQYDR